MKKFARNLITAVLALTLVISVVAFASCKRNEKYTVTFESNGGTVVEKITEVPHGTTISEPEAPVKSGYIFAGWFKDIRFSRQWVFVSDKVTSDTTLYAKWTYNETNGLDLVLNDASYTVRGIGGATNVSELVIPETYKGLPVATIAQEAFDGVKSFQSVFIPSSVKAVMRGAFRNCENLVSVTFAGQSATLGEQAFRDCVQLQSVTLPDGITTIEKETFYGCEKLSGVTIPANVTSIGDNAFSGCKSIVNVNLPASLRTVGENVFSGCTGIASLSVEAGNASFYSRINGEEINCVMATTANGNKLVVGCKNSVIPNNTAIIGKGAFYGCGERTGVLAIPDGVKEIEEGAFNACTNITRVVIPASVTKIGDRAFSNCYNLGTVTFTAPSEGSENEGIRELGEQAFSYCYELRGFNLPKTLTSIGRGLFCYCEVDIMTISYEDDVSKLALLIESETDENRDLYKTSVFVSGTRGSSAVIWGLA